MYVIWHTVMPRSFYCTFETKYTPFYMEGVSNLAYEFCYCVDIAVDHI